MLVQSDKYKVKLILQLVRTIINLIRKQGWSPTSSDILVVI